jgi:putative ATPase
MELFDRDNTGRNASPSPASIPLAERMRPRTLGEFVGQQHLLGEGKPLRILIQQDQIPSMIFWGPPGCGKTTLARIIAGVTKADFFQLSAVSSGVGEVRKVLDHAAANRRRLAKRTILFIDEIHRFNKAQQDALLHSVEDGVITLIGATTENPSFEVIAPLLSRCLIYVLEPLAATELNEIIDRALQKDILVGRMQARMGTRERELLMLLAGGDARIVLNGLETAMRLLGGGERESSGRAVSITVEAIEEAFQQKHTRYDKGGEEHYNVISAFIKSIRGSDPDAGVYWLARMLEGGEDPKFIARRMIVLASEDIGNADPYALTLATSCFTAVDYIGMPEARIVLAQTATYLASAPKSNASYLAVEEALSDVRQRPGYDVPLHLRNAPTQLMKDLEYGRDYKYSHEGKDHFIEQRFLPEDLEGKLYYRPAGLGAEKTIRERLNSLWKKKQR